ncbi:hypothetical protein VE04_02426 [Pseudogymnoascus sp. 24MN13]|nr:hypothetical protein VE04_02426 [Pseudogymnoascus sp. 24MN13]
MSDSASKFTSSAFINGIYIPSGLLIFGCFIVKSEWLPYAIALSAALAGWKIFDSYPKAVLRPDALQEFELKEKTIISHNVAIYRFKLPTPNSILGLPIGQHISISANLPTTTAEGETTARTSSAPTPPFPSYPTGNISKYMASLIVGQTIKVKGPKGAMVYTPNMVRHFGMIAGGTGITPMLQVIRDVIRGRAAGDTTEIDLLFANVNVEDILLKEDLDALAAADKGFRVHYVLNNPPEGWTGGVGFVTPEMIAKFLPKAAADVKVLLCGPPPMISAMKKATEGLGFTKAKPVSKLEDQVFAF